MDPQKLASLDPKLREAYQRVMGTSIPKTESQPVQTPTPTAPSANQSADPMIQSSASAPQSAIQPESASEPPVQPANFDKMNSEVSAPQSSPNLTVPAPQFQTTVIKNKSGMMPILIGIIIVVFVVVYAIFWTKIFNLKLPFLP